MKARIIFHCAAVVVLLATVALAQSKPKPHESEDERSAGTQDRFGSASGRSGSIVAAGRDSGNGQAQPSDVATGKRTHEPRASDGRADAMTESRSTGSTAKQVEYKDDEDQATRSGPGNNRPSN